MNIEKMRGEFELAAEQHFMLKERYLYWDENEEEYEDPEVQLAYEFFLLSRESLVIELPIIRKISDDMDCIEAADFALLKCREAIHAAGVKTK